jgi:hypothetical protein
MSEPIEMQLQQGTKFANCWQWSTDKNAWILIPGAARDAGVQLFPAPSASVEITTDALEEILADQAQGIAWPHGTITAPTEGRVTGANAVRMVGTGKITVRAQ